MATRPNKVAGGTTRRRAPAMDLDAREQQLVDTAIDLAERQMLDGSASSQIISHFLQLGSSMNLLKKEQLRHENNLLEAKTKSIASAEESAKMYSDALNAMRSYSGAGGDDYYDD